MLRPFAVFINGLATVLVVCPLFALAQPTGNGKAQSSSMPSEPLQLALIDAIAFSPNGNVLAAAGFDRSPANERVYQVVTWNLQGGARSSLRLAHGTPVTALCFSPDGTELAIAADNKVHLWDLAACKLVRTLKAGLAEVLAIGYPPSGRGLVSVSGEPDERSIVTWWDPRSGKKLHDINGPPANAWSTSVRFSADGATLAVVFDNAVRVFDARSRNLLQSFDGDQARFESADLSPDGKLVAVASGRKVSYFDVETAKLTREWTLDANEMGTTKRMSSRIMTVLFSPDGETVAVAVDLGKRLPSGMVIFEDLNTGQCIRTKVQVWGRMTRFAFSPGGECLAYARGDNIWRVSRENAQVSLALPTDSLAYEELDLRRYQSFINNWDDKAHPVRAALIRTLDEWNAIFSPAPVMFRNRPFHPEENVFADSQFLLVARVMWSTDKRVFDVESLTTHDDKVELRFSYSEPQDASFKVKKGLCLRIPKRDVACVTVFENGTNVATLNLSSGQWAIPPSGEFPTRRGPSGPG